MFKEAEMLKNKQYKYTVKQTDLFKQVFQTRFEFSSKSSSFFLLKTHQLFKGRRLHYRLGMENWGNQPQTVQKA